MSQLVTPDEVSTATYFTLLWQEIRAGFFVYRDPTEAEAIARRDRRQVLLRDSHIPWILSDVGSVAQFYDDVQDILAFTTWNKRLVVDPVLLTVLGTDAAAGSVDELAQAYRITCLSGRPGKRRLTDTLGITSKRIPKRRDLSGWLGLLREGSMWALLAGQLGKTLIGVGIVLGGVVGGVIEAGLRVASGGTDIFQRGNNKYFQAIRARALINAQRGLAAMPFLPRDDHPSALLGTFYALRDSYAPPEYYIDPRDYPTFDQIYRDPLGLMRNVGRVVGSFPSNAMRYLMHDVLGQMDNQVGRFFRGTPAAPSAEYDPLMRAALSMMHDSICPADSACVKQVARFLRLRALANDPRLKYGDPKVISEIGVALFGDFRKFGL